MAGQVKKTGAPGPRAHLGVMHNGKGRPGSAAILRDGQNRTSSRWGVPPSSKCDAKEAKLTARSCHPCLFLLPSHVCRWHFGGPHHSWHHPHILLFSHLWRTHHLLFFHPANRWLLWLPVLCGDTSRASSSLGSPRHSSVPHGARLEAALPPQDSRKLECYSFKEVCLLLGRAGGSGESLRTPAEILYSWGRLAFSTRQDPLPCSNIPSLPLGEPADEISIAVTLDKPFTRAWEGGRAAPWQNPWCKEGVQLPKGIPRDLRGCLRAGVMGHAVGGCTEGFQSPAVIQVPALGPCGLFPVQFCPGNGETPACAHSARWVLQKQAFHLERPKHSPKTSLLGSAHRVLLAPCFSLLAVPAPEIPP